MVLPCVAPRHPTILRRPLRKASFQVRLQTQPPRRSHPFEQHSHAFATRSNLRQQDSSEEVVQDRNTQDAGRRQNLVGRVFGKRGSRQRAGSERLSIQSLGRQSDVIVIRDVKDMRAPLKVQEQQAEIETTEAVMQSAFSAKEIESFLTERRLVSNPAQEVNDSIDALRPTETIMHDEAYQILKKILLERYTFSQLNRYLAQSLHTSGTTRTSAIKPRDTQKTWALAASSWQPGLTPLETRRHSVQRKHGSKSKVKVAEQVLRLVWQTSIQSEGQKVGELEMKLLPWQMSMLFDLIQNDRPYYESLIRPHLLLESSQIQPYRPDNIVRITSCSHDAEDIAQQLELALLGVKRVEVNLKPLLPMLADAGRLSSIDGVVRGQDLQYVADLTKCATMLESDETIAIYGRDEVSRRSAQRAILSILNIQPSSSFKSLEHPADEYRKKSGGTIVSVPLDTERSDLHRRHRGSSLARHTTPFRQTSDARTRGVKADTIDYDKTARLLTKKLHAVPEPAQGWNTNSIPAPGSYWSAEPRISDWQVGFCKVLHPRSKESHSNTLVTAVASTSTSDQSVIQSTVPGAETLLSYFQPSNICQPSREMNMKDLGNHLAELTAHFVPYPQEEIPHAKLPRIMLKFGMLSPAGLEEHSGLALVNMRAVLDSQAVNVCLPHEILDLRFQRRVSLESEAATAMGDQSIRDFCKYLKESSQSGKGALDAPSEVTFRLPHWLVNVGSETSSAHVDVGVLYRFERFEQVQAIDFTPLENGSSGDDGVTSVVERMGDAFSLVYIETERGGVYGRKTSLCLRKKNKDEASSTTPKEEGSFNSVAVSEQGDGSVRETPKQNQGKNQAAESQPDSLLHLSAIALQCATLLTRSTEGSLRPWAKT